jgi:transketolase
MREQMGITACDLFAEDDRVAIVLAEISTQYFEPALHGDPRRAVNLGIMEQSMVGVAAGFAMEGFHPIVHSITPFLIERPLEQIKLDFGYQGLGGTFVSAGASYDYGAEGATHHSPADVQAMLTIPGVEVLVPGSAAEVDRAIRSTYADGRITYLRTSVAMNATSFETQIGRAEVLRSGGRGTVLAVGPMLDRTLAAVEGMDLTVLYVTSVAPFDAETLVHEVTGPDVVVVEPFYEGTLTAAVSTALAGRPSRIGSVGVPRRFILTYGQLEEHDRELGLDTAGIRERITAFLDGR